MLTVLFLNQLWMRVSVSIRCVFSPPQQAWQMQSWTSRQVMPGRPPPTPCSALPCAKTASWCWKADPARSSRCPPPRPASTATLRSVIPEETHVFIRAAGAKWHLCKWLTNRCKISVFFKYGLTSPVIFRINTRSHSLLLMHIIGNVLSVREQCVPLGLQRPPRKPYDTLGVFIDS